MNQYIQVFVVINVEKKGKDQVESAVRNIKCYVFIVLNRWNNIKMTDPKCFKCNLGPDFSDLGLGEFKMIECKYRNKGILYIHDKCLSELEDHWMFFTNMKMFWNMMMRD